MTKQNKAKTKDIEKMTDEEKEELLKEDQINLALNVGFFRQQSLAYQERMVLAFERIANRLEELEFGEEDE